ncbi:DUF3110 domain-containing protein [Dolichospermum sp. LEGE 00240]|jgi:hypothetical protein|uniref:DUF3110 domain-containing protein n=1 Tax=Dolichospermum sp. LEGE 00240 TaxID=1828603 RepID=UPI0018820D81|nr:DUF3110 domain-containing protein [Dolichospermum sp. LEGE 00240]MDM3843703.1 DUF3110 domain-containing protein [Aphanizomenon gracile PMC638.10]MDM3849576.1 DUF3110 domain-containing protein [Aphanizomenon gracile PMC627.10]MDM3857941.1 DUF3110 domain-containing protein [Aphanizomenon gracile PMC649.10]MDM3861343.1 DUF3110 domain-containing protein [Aphanizomenon gracile PMC644.10]MBE9248698.1 DUF3110 domain-containing protein [Dolichospermum sp. LEGE 00240]
MRVFVLMFNAGTDNEGIHSIRISNAQGVEGNKILMFESEDDATRFALMLEAQDFAVPTVEMMNADDIKEFCESTGYIWEIVAENSELVLPPETNVEQTDWQAEPEIEDTDEDFLSYSPSAPEVANSDLDSIRRKLEGLL